MSALRETFGRGSAPFRRSSLVRRRAPREHGGMKLAPPALVLLASLAGAQVDVQGAERRTEVAAFGFDYEFNNGLSDSESDASTAGAWSSDLVGDLDDYYGVHVADARAVQVSALSSSTLSADLDATASTTGNLFSSDSSAASKVTVDFDVTAQVRYLFVANAQSQLGYNEARARVSKGGAQLFGIDASWGGSGSTVAFGWLRPGGHRLDALALAQAGQGSAADAQSASASFELKILDAADSDLNGVVTYGDAVLFAQVLLAGNLHADFDGDGACTLADWEAYAAAWFAATS